MKVQLAGAGVSQITLTAMDSGIISLYFFVLSLSGLIDILLGFMFTYAFGSFITGQLGDHFSPVGVVGGGLLGSTVCLLLIVYGASTSIIHNAALCGTWFLTCQLLHGAFQATGGPVNTAIMGSWFTSTNRGYIFGLWTCHQYIGDITAAIASGYLLHYGYDWRWCIIIPAVINGLWAFINFFQVPNRPQELGMTKDGEKYNPDEAQPLTHIAESATRVKVEEHGKAIGFIQAFSLPNVANYAFAFGFFKLVNYAMFFQLPIILSSHFSPSTANIISALYSVGMMPGGVICGTVSDFYGGRRACVIATFMTILCPLLWIFGMFMDSIPVPILLFLLACMGILVGGPNNIITSAVAADLADDPSIRGSKSALGTVTGIINGSGSVTAALGQLAIPILWGYGKDHNVGYRYVWFFLILCTLTGTGLMSPKVFKELYSSNESTSLASAARSTSTTARATYGAVSQNDRA